MARASKPDGQNPEPPGAAAALLQQIDGRRQEVERYLAATEIGNTRLLTAALVCTGLAALLTAAPALGGTGFIGWMKGALPNLPLPVWQLLCLGATALSVAAVVLTRKADTDGMRERERLDAARDSAARLEALRTLVSDGVLEPEAAAVVYVESVTALPEG